MTGLEFWDSGFVFGFSGFGFRVSGFEFRISGFGIRELGFGIHIRDSSFGSLDLEADRLVSGGRPRDSFFSITLKPRVE